jgi:NitT/TauT family transport system substrate-binding protein
MIKTMWRACAGAIAAMAVVASTSPAPAQQKSEISLSRQPGIFYMPSHIMEKNKLIEKHAAALGVPGVTTKWLTLSGGGAQTDALSQAVSISSIPAPAICCCCGIAPAVASRASSRPRRSR